MNTNLHGFQTFLTPPALEGLGAVTFEASLASLLTHAVVEAGVRAAPAWSRKGRSNRRKRQLAYKFVVFSL